jgi:hypothetical protein
MVQPPPDDRAALLARCDAAQQAADRAQQRLIQAGVVDTNDPPAGPSASANDSRGQAIHFMAVGAPDELELTIDAADHWAGARWYLAIVLAGGGLVLLPLYRWAPARDWLAAHVHLLLALAGIGWWLLAPLGPLGVVMFLAALFFSFRSTWPRFAGDSTSTIGQFSRSGF